MHRVHGVYPRRAASSALTNRGAPCMTEHFASWNSLPPLTIATIRAGKRTAGRLCWDSRGWVGAPMPASGQQIDSIVPITITKSSRRVDMDMDLDMNTSRHE